MIWSTISAFTATATLLAGSTLGVLWGGEVRRSLPDEPASPPQAATEPKSKPAQPQLTPPVEQVLRIGLAAAEAEPNLALSVGYLIQVGRSYSAQGDLAAATTAFQRARARLDQGDPVERRKWFSKDPLARIALALARNGDQDRAHRTFDQALDLIESSPPADLTRACQELIRTQIEAEGRAAAQNTIGRVRILVAKRRANLLPVQTADLFLIRLQALSGDFAGALAAVDALPDRAGVESADDRAHLLVDLTQIIRAADGTAGDPLLDRACRAVAGQAASRDRIRNQIALLKVLARLDRDAATEPLMAAIDAALADPVVLKAFGHLYFQALGAVGWFSLDRRDDEAVRRNARHAIQLLDQFPTLRQRWIYLSGISHTLVMIGDQTLVFDLARRLPDDEALDMCYGSATVGLRIRHREPEARSYDELVLDLFHRNIEAAPKDPAALESPYSDKAWERWSVRLACHHAARGEIGKALAAIKPLPLEEQRRALPGLAFILAEAGEPAGALDLQRWTTDPHTKQNIAIQAAVGVMGVDGLRLDRAEEFSED